MAANLIYFGFQIQDGPNAGLACGRFDLQVRKEDMYLWFGERKGVLKVSLHDERASLGGNPWRVAYTREHIESGALPRWEHEDRAPFKFTPTLFDSNGARPMLAIAVLRNALTRRQFREPWIRIRVDDDWARTTLAVIWQTRGNAIPPSEYDVLSNPLSLASGSRVWLTRYVEEVGCPVEPEAEGCVVEPVDWMPDGPSSPMLKLRGLRLRRD